ncbi:MAG: hypothetical protein LBB05_03150 [Puniceicoccales bacterium]|jgi:hypothetical protein|nr:hypothetical protein [Puniceicoccales bacterium]
MSAIKLSAQKVKDVSNLKKIAEAWREAVVSRGWILNGDIDSNGIRYITSFARQLAGQGKVNVSDVVLNDPYIYISSGDKYASKVQGDGNLSVATETISYLKNGVFKYTHCYTFATNCVVTKEYLFSYCLMLSLPANVPLNTTPLGFTRGLNKNGLWDEASGLYGSKGGYVVCCDGHVTWFDGNKPAKFLKWDQSGYTSDIRETVPNTVLITCTNDSRKVKADYMGENALAIICHVGTGET